MSPQLLGAGGAVDGGLRAAEKVGDHRMILFQGAQNRPQIRMGGGDGGNRVRRRA
jgi:hypothetical protein